MRILHVNSGNLFGGIEVLLVTLARLRHLSPEMEPEFAVCFPGKTINELRKTDVPVHELGAARVSRPWTVWRIRHKLRTLLREQSFDAVVCHGAWTQAIFGPVVRGAGPLSVLWLHDRPDERLGWLDRWASWSPPAMTICNSDYTLEGVGHLYPAGHGERVYCPVSLPRRLSESTERTATRAAFGATPEDVVILQIGRWEGHKGHAFHLEALGRFAREPGWVCWQVGGTQRPSEESYLQGIKAAAKRHGIADRVRFLGYQADLCSILDAADIYCQPNVRPEPFGITFIEALMAGLPVVGTTLGGPKEIIDASCGILVNPGDVPALSDALLRLIRDPQLRQRLGSRGPTRAAAISDPAERIGQLERLLVNLLGGISTPSATMPVAVV